MMLLHVLHVKIVTKFQCSKMRRSFQYFLKRLNRLLVWFAWGDSCFLFCLGLGLRATLAVTQDFILASSLTQEYFWYSEGHM